MAKNVEVTKKKNESNISLLKRFTKKVQESGVIKKSKSIRYQDRPQSDYVKKKKRLKSLDKTAEIQKKIKLGKFTVTNKRGHR